MELAGLLREKLKDIIPNPQVTVTVTGIHANFPTISAPARPLKVSPPPLSPDLKQKCCIA